MVQQHVQFFVAVDFENSYTSCIRGTLCFCGHNMDNFLAVISPSGNAEQICKMCVIPILLLQAGNFFFVMLFVIKDPGSSFKVAINLKIIVKRVNTNECKSSSCRSAFSVCLDCYHCYDYQTLLFYMPHDISDCVI